MKTEIRSSLCLSLLVSFVSIAKCGNILSISPLRSKSHHSMHQIISEKLAAEGHNITEFSFFKSTKNISNYAEILISNGTHSFVDSYTIDDAYKLIGYKGEVYVSEIEFSICHQLFKLPSIKKILETKEKLYDVLMAESQYVQCYNLLAHELDIPLIFVFPGSSVSYLNYMIGNADSPAFVPIRTSPYSTRMSFFERVANTLHYAILYAPYYYKTNDKMADISKTYFHTKLPTTETLHRQVALIFYNNHFSFLNRPSVPNAIDIAGIHIRESNSLPQDIQEFIDGAKYGVIFFSFGTTIKASSIHPKQLLALKEVFSTIPQRVIWRTNELNITDLPDNVKALQWYISEHKNVRAFISHCGLFGTLEAIHTATPIIAIPFLYDQFQNAKILAEREAAVLVDYHTMNTNIFREAINHILHNKKYQKNMQKLSNIFKDRPMSPLDTAIYWTEYVIRHKGAPHLRVAGADMPLYQYLLLDVIAFILVILGCVLYSLKYVICKIISYFLKRDIKYKKT